MASAEQQDQAFVLHVRPYRETSVLVDCFTAGAGRISIMYKGVRGASRQAGHRYRLLQPFQQLNLSWSGRHDLKSGRLLEASGAALFLQGAALYSGLYLNELLVRLLAKEEPHPSLFVRYLYALHELSSDASQLEPALRRFEQALLAELGYGLALTHEAESGSPVQPASWYRYHTERGFTRLANADGTASCFSGQDLLAIANNDWHTDAARQAAKRLMRLALAPHLGDKPLQSRQLFTRPFTSGVRLSDEVSDE